MRQRIMGCFVAVVQIKSEAAEPRYSRRVFLSLAPAQKAAERARERGLHAAVYVAELAPVGVVRHG